MNIDVIKYIDDIEHFGNNMSINDTGSSGYTDWQKYLSRITSYTSWMGVYTANIDYGSTEWHDSGTELASNTYYIELGDRFYHNNHKDHFDDDIDKLMFNASLTNNQIAIIFASGSYVSSFTYDCSYPYMVNNPNALIMGHIMDNQIRRPDINCWYSLHPQFFVVNLDLYKKLGCPSFNNSETKELVGIERSKENIHDNYTPLYIKHDGTFKNIDSDINLSFGWNIINEGLKAGYEIINVPIALRKHKKFFYYEEWLESKDNSNIDGTLHHCNKLLLSNLYRGWKLTYIFNTEKHSVPSLTDISPDGEVFKIADYRGFNDILKQYSIDSFAIVSSGFVGQWYMHKLGFHGQKTLIFDINATSVHFKEYTIKHWLGPKHQSYADFLIELADKDNQALYFLLQVFPKNHNLWRDQINQMWDEELSNWESINEFQEHWDYIKRSTETAIIDLVFNPKAGEIISKHRGNNYQFLFISNIFDNRIIRWQLDYDWKKIYKYYKNFYNSLPNKTIIIGTGIKRFKNLANNEPKASWASTTIKL